MFTRALLDVYLLLFVPVAITPDSTSGRYLRLVCTMPIGKRHYLCGMLQTSVASEVSLDGF